MKKLIFLLSIFYSGYSFALCPVNQPVDGSMTYPFGLADSAYSVMFSGYFSRAEFIDGTYCVFSIAGSTSGYPISCFSYLSDLSTVHCNLTYLSTGNEATNETRLESSKSTLNSTINAPSTTQDLTGATITSPTVIDGLTTFTTNTSRVTTIFNHYKSPYLNVAVVNGVITITQIADHTITDEVVSVRVLNSTTNETYTHSQETTTTTPPVATQTLTLTPESLGSSTAYELGSTVTNINPGFPDAPTSGGDTGGGGTGGGGTGGGGTGTGGTGTDSCVTYPNRVGCTDLGDPNQSGPVITDLDASTLGNWSLINMSSSCPIGPSATFAGFTHTINIQNLCDMTSIYIRPFILLVCSIIGYRIFVEGLS